VLRAISRPEKVIPKVIEIMTAKKTANGGMLKHVISVPTP